MKLNINIPVLYLKMAVILTATGFFEISAQAQQQVYANEDEMRDIFVAGGYGALFGATMGTAILPFLSGSPIDNIRVVAGGASIGFMMGSAYGLYNMPKSQGGSYFNYAPENDENYFYSMPPTLPGHGYQSPQKSQDEKNVVKQQELPKTGALIVGNGSHIGLAMPQFWIGQNQFGFVLASLRF
ncbi:hypothetical protein [Silvanigrella aquatica]|uniref:Glycine zipper domain-containing protein n=1 Tax=Silvanigrella aquatica TaxID=1915309 RepID=A0A1L4D3E3_9BACT|nr:hypothetical protein [Silvanigrella aquatica]APJ04726.1 hypothetical protein AXG55_12800 [Silvanigrella aquatica]